MSLDKMILDLSRDLNDSDVHIQNLERRLKELESLDNPLSIIEPGVEDLILSTVIPIAKVVSVREDEPNTNFFGSPSGLSMFFSTADDDDIIFGNREKWALFKFPSEIPKPPDIICIPLTVWLADAKFGSGIDPQSFSLKWEIFLIEDIFNIRTVTWNSAQTLNLVKYAEVGSTGFQSSEHPSGRTIRMCLDIVNSPARGTNGPFYGFLMKGSVSAGSGSVNNVFTNVQGNFEGIFEGDFDGADEGVFKGNFTGIFDGIVDEITEAYEGLFTGDFEGTLDGEPDSRNGEFDGDMDGIPTGLSRIEVGLFIVGLVNTLQRAFIIPEF